MVIETSKEVWSHMISSYNSNAIIGSLPWQNIASCSQLVGKSFLLDSNIKYYALVSNNIAICSLSVYRISDRVGRIRTPYCIPEFRRSGKTKELIRHVIENYDSSISQYIGFVSQSSKEFFYRIGYRDIDGMSPFHIKLYQPSTESYFKSDEMYSLLKLNMQVSR